MAVVARADSARIFTALLGGLVLIGLVSLASASWPLGYEKFGDGYYFFKHQIFFGLLPGLLGFLVALKISTVTLKKMAPLMLIASIVLLVLVFIPGIGADFGTSHSWIRVGPISLQPSEIVKLTFLCYLAAWLEKRDIKSLSNLTTGLLPFATLLGVVTLLLILQPDTGTLAIIVAMSVAAYFVAGAPIRYFALLGLVGTVMLTMLFIFSPYRAARFTTFLHPELDPQGIGYHINQALLAVGSGGIMGRGLGHSVQKFQYLPEVAGDSIFAVMAEEFGFIFTLSFLLLYLGFLLTGLKIAAESKDLFERLVAAGIVTWLGFQAIVNIGAMLGILPITGVPLPFISYGGTAMAVSLTAAGLLINIGKNNYGRIR